MDRTDELSCEVHVVVGWIDEHENLGKCFNKIKKLKPGIAANSAYRAFKLAWDHVYDSWGPNLP
ncbi:hypothetical protein CRG98_010811 [Punica granatum]|uniref:Uncharacterized protein n=1 Tax=Punica granatum TaxID=22663 RepID=A0A2I0KJS2_PUNGR|nr:hypothetical protein CRG98_010811 [Punica granatum]